MRTLVPKVVMEHVNKAMETVRKAVWQDSMERSVPKFVLQTAKMYMDHVNNHLVIAQLVVTRDGLGDDCTRHCSPNCHVSDEYCEQSSGDCTDGCVSGFYGTDCMEPCRAHCNGCDEISGMITTLLLLRSSW